MAQNALKRAPSLRDEHKAHTERSLREAALKLFASQGYDTTTIEEIAEKAGVSARTFFRYFPTKESVLYLHERLWFQSLTETFLGQPRSLSDVEALKATYVELSPEFAPKRRSLQLYTKALASSTTLRGRQQDRHVEDIRGGRPGGGDAGAVSPHPMRPASSWGRSRSWCTGARSTPGSTTATSIWAPGWPRSSRSSPRSSVGAPRRLRRPLNPRGRGRPPRSRGARHWTAARGDGNIPL